MISLEILSINGTILRQYNGEKVVLPKFDYKVDDFKMIEFTGEQVWLCRVFPDGKIMPMQMCGFIYRLKDKERSDS